ncbi:MAG: hypothetical protein OEV06_12605, partial [Anaerolineae bacterium]|nr:hypothetical protein [Anaerolineae bacterium]
MKDRGRPEVQLTFTGMDADPVISPDGEWIAFRRWVNIPPKDDPYGDHPIESELRIMDKNGAFKKTLMSIEELDSLLPMDEHPIYGGIHPHRIEFIRDSDLIMFSTFAWGMRYSSHYDLHVVDSKTSEWQTLFGMWGAVSVTLSPNGKHIAVANSGIHIVGIANLTIRQDIIVNGFYHSGAPWINNVRPQWSHDSSFFVVAVESDLNSEDQYVYGNQIWQVFVDERPPILLSTITTIYEAGSIRWLLNAKISLDLGRMYYACPDPVSPPPAALLCFSALNGENLIVYPFPHDRNPIYPFEQEDFPTQSVLGPTDYKDKWVDARHRIGYWGEGIALIQSGPPA